MESPMDQKSFDAFIQKVRAGDEQAAEELVRLYEPEIRREVRLRLRDGRLRRDFDSEDICQSVLASFFLRATLGQYELEEPKQLIKLLVTMTRNKLIGKVRKLQSQIRDHRRIDENGSAQLRRTTKPWRHSRLAQNTLTVWPSRVPSKKSSCPQSGHLLR